MKKRYTLQQHADLGAKLKPARDVFLAEYIALARAYPLDHAAVKAMERALAAVDKAISALDDAVIEENYGVAAAGYCYYPRA